MKFSCSQQSLVKAINTVSKAVTSRTTIPILKGILLKASADGTLTLSASDLDLSIEKKINVQVEDEGSIVVLSKLFSDIIRKLPNEDILIEEKENNMVMVKTASSEFTIIGLAADEFPAFNEIEEEARSLSFEKELFMDMIKKTSFSASIDESKGVLVGVLMEVEPESLNMVALDGFRMAVAREKMKNEQKVNIIVAARIINEVSRIVAEAGEDEDVQITFSNKKAVILAGDTRMIVRLLEGEFIRYQDIIPAEHDIRVKINRAVLLESIERASLLAKEGKNNLIKLSLHNDLMTITSRSDEGNVKEEIIMEKTGEDLEIGFNSKYVSDVLKAIEDEEIIMEFTVNTKPCLVKPLTGDSYEYLILPVRISSNY